MVRWKPPPTRRDGCSITVPIFKRQKTLEKFKLGPNFKLDQQLENSKTSTKVKMIGILVPLGFTAEKLIPGMVWWSIRLEREKVWEDEMVPSTPYLFLFGKKSLTSGEKGLLLLPSPT